MKSAGEISQRFIYASLVGVKPKVNTIALRMTKTLWSFDHSECNTVKEIEQETGRLTPTWMPKPIGLALKPICSPYFWWFVRDGGG